MTGGLMQLVAYGAQDVHLNLIEPYRYYKQILELNILTDVIIRNEDGSINVEYTEKINNIINTIRKRYPKMSVETMRDIIVLYIRYVIDDCYSYMDYCNTNIVFYLIKIKDKEFMKYIDEHSWNIKNINYQLALGYFNGYDYHYNKHLDNNFERKQYNYGNSDEEYETDEEY